MSIVLTQALVQRTDGIINKKYIAYSKLFVEAEKGGGRRGSIYIHVYMIFMLQL